MSFVVHLVKLVVVAACSANQQSTTTLTETRGIISSIKEWLPVNAKCQWTITAPAGNVCKIDVRALFRSKNCSDNEYLRVYDGSNTTSALVAELKCKDRSLISYFYSSGRSLLLEVQTGPVINSSKMVVEYQAHVKQGRFTSGFYVSALSQTRGCRSRRGVGWL